MSPLFSVIIPLYNKEDYITDTVNSVLQQSASDFELIIVDDASTDNSLEVVKLIKDPRIKYIENANNNGLSQTRNIGIKNAKGTIIALLDADDVWLPDFLESIKYLHHKFSEASIYATDYFEWYSNKRILKIKKNIPRKLENTSFLINDFFKLNLYEPILTPSSLAFKRTLSSQKKVFDKSITFAEDVDFYIRYCSRYKVAYCNKPLVYKKVNVLGQITKNGISNKNIPDIDSYKSLTKENSSLIKYLDFCRYFFAHQFRLEKNIKKSENLLKSIDFKNLTLKQRFLLRCPLTIALSLHRFKLFLLKSQIKITSY